MVQEELPAPGCKGSAGKARLGSVSEHEANVEAAYCTCTAVSVTGAGKIVWPKRAWRWHAQSDEVPEGMTRTDVSAYKFLLAT